MNDNDREPKEHGPEQASWQPRPPQEAGEPHDPLGKDMDVETRALVYQVAGDLQRQRLTGLGGWLAVFIVLYILCMLSMAYSYLTSDPYEAIELGLTRLNPIWTLSDVAWVALVITTLVFMFRRNRAAPTICRALVIYGFIQDTLYTIIDPESLLAAIEREMGIDITFLCAISIIAHLAFMLGWVSYFNRSKRVKYTFGLDFPEDRISKVFQ